MMFPDGFCRGGELSAGGSFLLHAILSVHPLFRLNQSLSVPLSCSPSAFLSISPSYHVLSLSRLDALSLFPSYPLSLFLCSLSRSLSNFFSLSPSLALVLHSILANMRLTLWRRCCRAKRLECLELLFKVVVHIHVRCAVARDIQSSLVRLCWL